MIFETTPPDGTVVEYDGRTFEVMGSRSHTTRDNRQVDIVTFKTTCARCDADMLVDSVPVMDRINKKCRPCIAEHKSWKRGQPKTRDPIPAPPKDVLDVMRRAKGVRFWDGKSNLPSNWVGFVIAPLLNLHAIENKKYIHDSLCLWVENGIFSVRKVEKEKGTKYFCDFSKPSKTKNASAARQGKVGGVHRADALLRKF